MGPIAVGIAGWSYPDWKDTVYGDSHEDALVYISRFVEAIEINSTFYRPPSAKVVEAWLRRTAPREGFFFTAKLHRDFTHAPEADPSLIEQFHTGFAPMLQAGRLRHLLAQFRYDFDDRPEHRRRLGEIARDFGHAFDLVVELRHRSWQEAEALSFLEGLGVTVCNLDYPTGGQSFQMECCTVGRHGYFRLHGRNYAAWFSKAGRDETYNYYYNRQELGRIKTRIDRLAQAFERLTVITNNHYRGAEVANAIELKYLLTGDRQPVPPALLKTYPALQEVALPDSG